MVVAVVVGEGMRPACRRRLPPRLRLIRWVGGYGRDGCVPTNSLAASCLPHKPNINHPIINPQWQDPLPAVGVAAEAAEEVRRLLPALLKPREEQQRALANDTVRGLAFVWLVEGLGSMDGME